VVEVTKIGLHLWRVFILSDFKKTFRCSICKSDIPCEHMVDNARASGWDTDNDRAEEYSKFLHDGDFEKYQPNCYLDRMSKEYLQACLEAEREMLRAIWIRNRLTTYLSPDWNEMCMKVERHYAMILKYETMIQNYDDYRRQRPSTPTAGTDTQEDYNTTHFETLPIGLEGLR